MLDACCCNCCAREAWSNICREPAAVIERAVAVDDKLLDEEDDEGILGEDDIKLCLITSRSKGEVERLLSYSDVKFHSLSESIPSTS